MPAVSVGVVELVEAGDSGVHIELWQRRLWALVAALGIGSWSMRRHVPWRLRTGSRPAVTGVHDEASVAWTRAFQEWARVDVDGVAGEGSLDALIETLADRGDPWAVAVR